MRVVNTASLVRGDPWSIMWKERCFIQEDVQDPRRGVHWADKGWVSQPPEGRGGRHNCREHHHRAPPGHGHLPNPEEDLGMPRSQSLLFGLFFQSMNDTCHQKMQFLSNSPPAMNHKAGSRLPWAGNPKARTWQWAGHLEWATYSQEHANEGFSGWPSRMNQTILISITTTVVVTVRPVVIMWH